MRECGARHAASPAGLVLRMVLGRRPPSEQPQGPGLGSRSPPVKLAFVHSSTRARSARSLLAGCVGIRREGIAELPYQTTSPQARARRGRGHLEGFALCGWAEAGGDTPVELEPPVQAARGLIAAAGECESRPREPLPPTPAEANARACTHRRRCGL